jgi:FHS family L-fucose permease-like MFS transporter
LILLIFGSIDLFMTRQKNNFAFFIITILFFLWGFTTVLNDILVPYFKSKFNLGDTASMLVQTTFFGAYGLGAFIYYLYSKFKTDLLNQIGYKNGILLGLSLATLGSVLFYPISYSNNYYIYLIPLFIIGIGFTVLQIACNPYVTLLGDSKSASSRLNLAQGINSLGTTLAPIIGAYFLLSSDSENQELGGPFLILGGLFLLASILIYFFKLPEYKTIESETNVNLFANRQVTLGMLAIFLYVGAEVAIGSKLVEYLELKEIVGFDTDKAGTYVGIYWAGAMIGRLSSAFILNKELTNLKRVLYSLISTIGTVFIISTAIYITKGLTIADIYPLLYFIPIQFIALMWFKNSNQKVLALFAIISALLLLLAFIVEGEVAMWSMIAIGLFNSIMWSNIFTISINNLGSATSKASSLLIIMITGGALFPLLMGYVSDNFSLKIAYLIPIVAYLYIAFYGFISIKKTRKNTL